MSTRTATRPTIAAIREASRLAGNHFFDKSTMSFFDSKVYPTVYGHGVFVTSEQQPEYFDYRTGETTVYPRLYTVRLANLDGSVMTLGDGGDYKTLAAAREVAQIFGRWLSTVERVEIFEALWDSSPWDANVRALAQAASQV